MSTVARIATGTGVSDASSAYTRKSRVAILAIGELAVSAGKILFTAFLDASTGSVYLSGTAPIHVFDGLPEKLVLQRAASGKVIAVESSVTSRFLRDGRFYTREQAARAMKSITL